TPWHVADAPAPFIESQILGIVGIEIPIDRLEGKWKVSQNRTVDDRKGVVAGLTAAGHTAMASLVRERTGDSAATTGTSAMPGATDVISRQIQTLAVTVDKVPENPRASAMIDGDED